jgi:hypothetical protein
MASWLTSRRHTFKFRADFKSPTASFASLISIAIGNNSSEQKRKGDTITLASLLCAIGAIKPGTQIRTGNIFDMPLNVKNAGFVSIFLIEAVGPPPPAHLKPCPNQNTHHTSIFSAERKKAETRRVGTYSTFVSFTPQNSIVSYSYSCSAQTVEIRPLATARQFTPPFCLLSAWPL